MISRNSSNVCSLIRNNANPSTAKLPFGNNRNNCTTKNHSGNSRSSNCYRPLQHLYKTMYSPTYGNHSSSTNFACICHPLERYKTTNMTYGSFHYNNWAFMQKNRSINTDRTLFARCYNKNNKQQKINSKSKCNNRLTDAYNSDGNPYWQQATSDGCCPTNCCNNITSNLFN